MSNLYDIYFNTFQTQCIQSITQNISALGCQTEVGAHQWIAGLWILAFLLGGQIAQTHFAFPYPEQES